MFTLTVQHNLDEVFARMDAMVERQIPFAAAKALTATAQDVQAELTAELPVVLDRPTPFTLNAFGIRTARKDNLTSEVFVREAQSAYLERQIYGGVRAPGPHGIRLPGNIELNAFGNIPRGLTNRLKAAAQNGTLGPALAKRLQATGNRRKGAAPVQLFYGKPRGKGWDNAPVGIWRRIPGKPGKLIPLIVFEDTPATYEARLPFHEIATRTAQRMWPIRFNEALALALRTAR